MKICSFNYNEDKGDYYTLSPFSMDCCYLQHFVFDNECLMLEEDDRVYKLVQSNMHTATCPVYIYKHEGTYIAVLHAFDEHNKHDGYHSYIVMFGISELADALCEIYLLLR